MAFKGMAPSAPPPDDSTTAPAPGAAPDASGGDDAPPEDNGDQQDDAAQGEDDQTDDTDGDAAGGDQQDGGQEDANPDGSIPNVTPQMQQEFEKVMDDAQKLIYGKATFGTVLQSLKAGNNPISSLARTTITLILRLKDAYEQNKAPIDDAVLFGVGKAILEDLAQTATLAKIHDFSQHDIDVAFYNAMDMYRAIGVQKGWLDPKEFQQEIQQIKQADADGTLDKILPGMQEVAQKVGGAPHQYAGAQHAATGGNPEPGSQADQAAPDGVPAPPGGHQPAHGAPPPVPFSGMKGE